jgi:hypothetical protein
LFTARNFLLSREGRAAIAAGVTRYRVEQLTGIAKTTIIRILRADGPQNAVDGPGTS